MGMDYRLHMENLDVRGLSHVLKTLDRLFTSILSEMTTGVAACDQVRFVMHSPQVTSAVALCFKSNACYSRTRSLCLVTTFTLI